MSIHLPDSLRLPAADFSFTEDGVAFRASTPQELADKVRAYRLANRQPSGCPEREVAQKLAKDFPRDLQGIRTDAKGEVAAKPDSMLTEAVRGWLQHHAAHPSNFAPAYEVKTRQQICGSCPRNALVHYQQLQADLILTSRGRSLSSPPSLHACQCFHHHNTLACLIEGYTANPVEEQIKPSHCWVPAP